MQILRTLLMATVSVTATIQSPHSTTRSDSLLVTAVIDGATIQVATIGRVRLLGINAPKLGHSLETAAPFARDAKARLSALVWRRWIRLEWEGAPTHSADRHRAYVWTEDGQFVNAMLVREGLARVSGRMPLSRLEELQSAEAEAQGLKRGLWSATGQPEAKLHRPIWLQAHPRRKIVLPPSSE